MVPLRCVEVLKTASRHYMLQRYVRAVLYAHAAEMRIQTNIRRSKRKSNVKNDEI